MTTPSWDRVGDLFYQALLLPSQERPSFLDAACAEDAELRAELEDLLGRSADANQFFASLTDTVIHPSLAVLAEEGAPDAHLDHTYGPYRVLEQLGQGGMGVVYLAEDTRLGRRAALKFLPQRLTNDESARNRLVREARAVSMLDHPNICSVYGLDETPEGQSYIAMAYYPGETLAERIARSASFRLEEVLEVSKQLAHGLASAHAHRITHRDLTPGNVMLVRNGTLRILDFGLAAAGGSEEEPVRAGTAAYMAPEQVRGNAVDARADVWSLGVILYEMLTGQRPFKGESVAQTLAAILETEPRPITELRRDAPAPLVELIERMLRKQPADRPLNGAAVLMELEALGGPDNRPRRRRSLLVATLVGVLFAGSFMAYQTWSPSTAFQGEGIRIAVLPFDDLTADSNSAYLASGIHNEVLTQLSKVGPLTVISRTSVLPYATTQRSLRQIADELNVAAIVEGSVQRVGDQVRVRMQLVDARTEGQLWAQQFDRQISDVFAVQSEIALGIADALEATLAPEERARVAARPTENAAAYDAYLQGREYQSRPGYDWTSLRTSERFYRRAVALDPDFALAWARLAVVLSRSHWYGYESHRNWGEEAGQAAERAVHLAPELPEAHLAMGTYQYYVNRAYGRALVEFHAARQGLPSSAEIHLSIGFIHRRRGEWAEAFRSFQRAVDLDPRSAGTQHALAETYAATQRFPEAVASYDRVLALDPEFHFGRVLRAQEQVRWRGDLAPLQAALDSVPASYDPGGAVSAARWQLAMYTRDYEEAIRAIELSGHETIGLIETPVPAALFLAAAYRAAGSEARAHRAYDTARIALESSLRSRPDRSEARILLAQAYAGLGRTEDAVREARRAAAELPPFKDALLGPQQIVAMASVLAQAGQLEDAVDVLEQIVRRPGGLTAAELRLDPRWDALRGDERFQRLIKQ